MSEPARTCSCGCGQATDGLWVSGHDSKALHYVLHKEFGDTRGFLEAYGYGPGKQNLYEEMQQQGATRGRRKAPRAELPCLTAPTTFTICQLAPPLW